MHVLKGLNLTAQLYCGLVIMTGVFGNTLVLIVFLARWSHLKTYESFILVLAGVDLLGTLVAPTFFVLESNKIDFRPIGTPGCKFFYFIMSLCIHVSSYTLVMVSVDRYIAVRNPWKDRTRICRGMISMTWILGIALNMEWLIGNGMVLSNAHRSHRNNSISSNHVIVAEVRSKERWSCRMKSRGNEIEYLMYNSAFLQTFIPVIVLSILHLLIFRELNKNSKESSQYKTDEDIQTAKMKNRKTTKLLLIMTVVFFVCITPKQIAYMYYHFNHKTFSTDDYEFFININVLLNMLKYSNCCLNPLIYGKLHESFHNRVKLCFASRGNPRSLIRQETIAAAKFYLSRPVSDVTVSSEVPTAPSSPRTAVRLVSFDTTLEGTDEVKQNGKIPPSPSPSSSNDLSISERLKYHEF